MRRAPVPDGVPPGSGWIRRALATPVAGALLATSVLSGSAQGATSPAALTLGSADARTSWHFTAPGGVASHVTLILFNPTGTVAHVWVRASSARTIRLWSVTVKRQVTQTVPLPAALVGDAVSLLADRNIIASRLVDGSPVARFAFGEPGTGKRSPETLPMPEHRWRFSPLPTTSNVVILTMYNPNHVAVQVIVQIAGTRIRLRAHVAARMSEEVSLSLRAGTNAYRALLVTGTGAIIPARSTFGPSGAGSSYGTPSGL